MTTTDGHYWLILLGRCVCKAHNPQRAACGVSVVFDESRQLNRQKSSKVQSGGVK
jgi:endonuclease III